jgi:hypothetical protein
MYRLAAAYNGVATDRADATSLGVNAGLFGNGQKYLHKEKTMDEAKLQWMIDRQEIYDCLVRFTRGVDRFDRELLISAFHEDATDDHGAFVGSPAEFADWDFIAHSRQRKTMHAMTNHFCEIDGDVAHAETYCTYFGYNEDGTIDVVGARYLDRLEKRKIGWRIADRICTLEWNGALKSGDEVDTVLQKMLVQLGDNAVTGRNKQDISYARPLRVTRPKNVAAPQFAGPPVG